MTVPSVTVLVIDDEDVIRNSVRLILEDAGYDVCEAADGRAGLSVLRAATSPMVVLLDLMMPRMSGVSLLREVSADPSLAARHAFILFTAARAFRAETLVFYLPGRRLFEVPKPFAIEELVATVERAAQELGSVSVAR